MSPLYVRRKISISGRVIDIESRIVASLRRHRAGQEMERRVAGNAWDARIPDLVFTTPTGAPIDGRALIRSLVPTVAGQGRAPTNPDPRSPAQLASRPQTPMFIAVSHTGGVAERSNAAVLKFGLGSERIVCQRPPTSGAVVFTGCDTHACCTMFGDVRADASA